MNYSSHLSVAKNLLSAYKPVAPFHLYLKAYFKQNKKHGSKDRKLISALCYNYFRLGFALKNISIEEKILIAFFLCEHSSSAFLQALKPGWNDVAGDSLREKLSMVNGKFLMGNIFPFVDELSDEIDFEKFNLSFLLQPKLFIRIRPAKHYSVFEKLDKNNFLYDKLNENCIALPNSAKANEVIDLDEEAVVQDYNSQRVGELLQSILNHKHEIDVWDCCAASGGKSIMAFDINPKIKLTVSDKRKSILKNLHDRFARAGIKNYTSFVGDLTTDNKQLSNKKFDLIIADVPCTGSGTWARTPEQLCYFNQKEIKKYANLQMKIVENVIRYLKPEGCLLYITCSVFKKENEDVVEFIKEKLQMNLMKIKMFKGYKIQADTMFAALLSPSSNSQT